MKEYTLYLIFLQLFFSPSSPTTCKTDFISTYVPQYIDLHGRPFFGCNFFGRPQSYVKFVVSATITCSNVSPNVHLNYTYTAQNYPQDLVITNSTIPHFPSNSSLSTFREIRQLILKNLGIETISTGAFKHLEKVRSLDLSYNKLEEIPEDILNNPSTLEALDLSHNRIKSVQSESVSGLNRLDRLYLNGNQISVLQKGIFENLTALETLDVSDNPLEEFQDVGFKNLRKLRAKNMLLKQFNVDLSKLMVSDCDMSNNSLEMIDFDNFPSMINLNLANNHLTTLNNFGKLKCVEVFLNNNNITRLDELPNDVKKLDLSHNKIRFLYVEYSNHNSSLQHLNLNYNQISTIIPGTFWELSNLNNLKLQHNHITLLREDTFANCSNLKEIDLSYNKISYIQHNAFTGLSELKILNMSHNHLQIVKSGIISKSNSLEEIYVDHNQLFEFPVEEFLDHFNNLKKISLNNNNWNCESVDDILRWLNIRNVEVVDKEFVRENNVTGIDCKFNKLS